MPSLVVEYPGTDRPGGDTAVAVARPNPPGERSETEKLKKKDRDKSSRRMRGGPVRSPQTERPVLVLCTRLQEKVLAPERI